MRWVALIFSAGLLIFLVNQKSEPLDLSQVSWSWGSLGVILALAIPNLYFEYKRWCVAKDLFGIRDQPRLSLHQIFAGMAFSFFAPGRLGQFIGRSALARTPKEAIPLAKASWISSFTLTLFTLGCALLASPSTSVYSLSFLAAGPRLENARLYLKLIFFTGLRYGVFVLQWAIALQLGWENLPSIILFLGGLTLGSFGIFGNLFIRENIALISFPFLATHDVIFASLVIWMINVVSPSVFGIFSLARHTRYRNWRAAFADLVAGRSTHKKALE